MPGGPTILALCHPVKNAGEDNILPRGGGAYLNEVDGNLTAVETDGVVQLHWQGKFRGPDFAPMTFHLRSVTHERLKDTKGRLIPTVIAEHMSELAEKEFREITLNHEDTVLRIVAADGKLSVAEIAMRAGWLGQKDRLPMKSRVHRCLKALEAAKTDQAFAREMEVNQAGQEAIGEMAESSDSNKRRKMAQKSGTAKTPYRSRTRSRNIPAGNLERHLHVVQYLRTLFVFLPWNVHPQGCTTRHPLWAGTFPSFSLGVILERFCHFSHTRLKKRGRLSGSGRRE